VGLSCGGAHCCAVLADATVRCWGDNVAGQLGDGSTSDRSTAVTVPGLSQVVQLTTRGNGHTCARRTDGTLVCWGLNATSQLGDGTMTNRTAPTPVTF
jgi:alpha-tubulin suppressor-like RCC1 family protein